MHSVKAIAIRISRGVDGVGFRFKDTPLNPKNLNPKPARPFLHVW